PNGPKLTLVSSSSGKFPPELNSTGRVSKVTTFGCATTLIVPASRLPRGSPRITVMLILYCLGAGGSAPSGTAAAARTTRGIDQLRMRHLRDCSSGPRDL